MSRSKHRQDHDTPDLESHQTKREYEKPRLERLGRIRDLTRMPGGSVSIEGASGKPHKQ